MLENSLPLLIHYLKFKDVPVPYTFAWFIFTSDNAVLERVGDQGQERPVYGFSVTIRSPKFFNFYHSSFSFWFIHLFSIFPLPHWKIFGDFSAQMYCPSLKKFGSQSHKSARVFWPFLPLAAVNKLTTHLNYRLRRHESYKQRQGARTFVLKISRAGLNSVKLTEKYVT